MKFKNLLFIAYQNLLLEFKHTKISLCWLPLTFAILIFAKSFFLGEILERDENFIIYLSIGVWVWQYISLSIIAYSSCIYNNQLLINIKINPMNFIHIIFLRMFIILVMYGLVLIIFLMLYDLNINFVYLFSSLFLLLIGSYQLGKILSIISLFARDITVLINSFLIVIFFLSPIFWYPEQLSISKQQILFYNPIFHLLNIFRDSIILGTFNSLSFGILTTITFILFAVNQLFVNKVIFSAASRV
jgi:ABC-type polysaccharide/polyol phosphate export permease